MPIKCTICDRPDRAEIENALLNSATSESSSMESIAAQYDLSVDELKAHMLFHVPIVNDSASEEVNSLTRKIKLREVDVLATMCNEYLTTLRATGRRINRMVQTSTIPIEDDDKQLKMAKLLTKPVVDLYVGLGGEIRQTVKTMADIERMLNGPETGVGSGLTALAQAIRGSDSNNG